MDNSLIISDGLFELKLSGDFMLESIEEILDTLISHKEWKPGDSLLVDETEFNAGNMTVEDIYTVTRVFEDRRVALGQAKIAIYVAREVEYGMNRMWGAIAVDRIDTKANVFRSRKEAIAWLSTE